MPGLRFGVLGPVVAWRESEEVGLRSGKRRLVLALLLLHANSRVDRDRIIDVAWGERPPPSAVNLVQKYVGDVRRALGLTGRELECRGSGYVLRVEPDQLDSTRFSDWLESSSALRAGGDPGGARRELVAALGLWRGPAFSGLDTPDSLTERARLDEYRVGAAEELAELDLLRGEHALAAAELSRLVAEHPFRERARELLMVALHRGGRRADALAVYRDAHRVLADELGTDPGPGLRRVHEQVLREDPALDQPVTGREPDVVPLYQLPPDIPDFTGRAGPLAELLAALADGRVPAAVVGAPGTGKSTLAVHAAHRVRERFPDGQLYLDLAGTSANPRDPLVVLAELLRALGVSDAVMPDSLHERSALFRSRLADRRVLVLLDDAADARQVRPLLPATSGCAVLVTSRRRLPDLTGARHVELDVLTPGEAQSLLARVVGSGRADHEPESAAAILRSCGHLPLAIRIAGAKLAGRPAWTLRVLRDRLEDESRRLRELRVGDLGVRASFDLSLGLLPEDASRAFCLLGLLGPQTLPGWVVGPLLDRSGADEVVDVLIDANLLQLVDTDAVGQPRYRLHDLLRAYAAEAAADLPEPTRRDAVTRVLGGWLALAERARDLMYPSMFRPTPGRSHRGLPEAGERIVADPIGWFDVERGTLLAAIELAVAWQLDEPAWELALAAVTYYDHRSLYQDWDHSHRMALGAVRAAGNRQGEAALLRGLGQVHIYRDNDADALRTLTRCLDLYRAIGDERGEGLALSGLGTIQRVLGRHELALDHVRGALRAFEAVGDRNMTAQMRSAIGSTLLRENRCDEARGWLDDALRLARDLGDRHREAAILRSTSELHRATGRTVEALRCLVRSLTIFNELGDDRCAAYAQQNMGRVYADAGDHIRAAHVLKRSAVEFRRNGDRRNEADCWYQLGRLDANRGDTTTAHRHLERALALWRTLGESGSESAEVARNLLVSLRPR
ncbi:AfsR/SARP family transcriptional regulator [Umezawaea beigongshangensis]|uniref:AfsR/SARP family transcriptional regulator n=1 Tax=Umezawaea beigongshangensis TaxID=2780383 RepID=UPI0018F27133|nr:BTAD domain-containing putative transcriptional regulator [Umezawaea beigongshangensis]